MEDLLITYFCGIAVVGVFIGIMGMSDAVRNKEFPWYMLVFILFMSILWPVLFVIACFSIGTNSETSG